MIHDLSTLVATATLERVTLLVNHVLAAEPVAMQRLRAHVGRCIRLQAVDWPGLLPALPAAAYRITPAGLLEMCADAAAVEPDLRIDVDMSNPALLALQALAGQRPRIEVSGDAALAGDVNWLFDNLRWDIEDDLEGLVGPAAAHRLGELGRAIALAVRSAAKTLAGTARNGEPTR
jgi:ubiquinone biosynthesis accessory factor UbiJ